MAQNNKVSLTQVAQNAMLDKGFFIDFPSSVHKEVSVMQSTIINQQFSNQKDLRDLKFFSIDNDDSKDLDQLTYAEDLGNGTYKIYIAVADVDCLVKKGSATDNYAGHNTTSVYTPTKVFPMLPPELSTDITSLNENVDRHSIVTEAIVDKDGGFTLSDIYPALVHNYAQLAYNAVAAFLEQDTILQHPVASQPEFAKQIQLQDAIAQKIKEFRERQGALSFSTIELKPIVIDDVVVSLTDTVQNRANLLIENFMIAANVCVTKYLMGKNLPTLKRIVRTPKRWDRIVELAKGLQFVLPEEPNAIALRKFLQQQQKLDPIHFPDLSLAMIKLIGRGEYIVAMPGMPSPGHFDLALQDYAHTTAPNRRFPDLIMQRLLKSSFLNIPQPYTASELDSIAVQCTTKEDDAGKVDRRVRKSAAAMVLSTQIGSIFKGIITGSGEKGTWVRLIDPPVEGKLARGYQGLDVGDQVTVKLISVDIAQGFIDFMKV